MPYKELRIKLTQAQINEMRKLVISLRTAEMRIQAYQNVAVQMEDAKKLATNEYEAKLMYGNFLVKIAEEELKDDNTVTSIDVDYMSGSDCSAGGYFEFTAYYTKKDAETLTDNSKNV